MTSPTVYHLKINSRKNKATPSLARSVFLLEDHNGKFVGNVCLLQYHVLNNAQRVEEHVQQHGNCKKSNPTPFYLLKKSSLHAIQEDVKTKPSRTVYESHWKNAGGLCVQRLWPTYPVANIKFTMLNQKRNVIYTIHYTR